MLVYFIFPSTFHSPKWALPFMFPTLNFICIFQLQHVSWMSCHLILNCTILSILLLLHLSQELLGNKMFFICCVSGSRQPDYLANMPHFIQESNRISVMCVGNSSENGALSESTIVFIPVPCHTLVSSVAKTLGSRVSLQ